MKELLANLKRTMARVVGIQQEAEPRASRRVLFVCMGNICRSPTAEGVFRKLLAEQAPELDVEIDSAGTHGFHDGAAPDPRACRAAERRGVDLKPLRARRVTERDFERFELVLAMDRQNLEFLLEVCPAEYRPRVKLLLEFAPHLERSACMLVQLDGQPVERRTEVPAVPEARFADALRELGQAGADEIIVVASPITERSIRALGEALP